ncbi:hypothetical protein NKG05_18300 [Oerskovia sp. M15]
MTSTPSAPSGVTNPRTLWLGTYPDGAPAGSGEGIWRVAVDGATGELGTRSWWRSRRRRRSSRWTRAAPGCTQ